MFEATTEAGFHSPADFLDLPAGECEEWIDFVTSGASRVRTQMLLAQIIQVVIGAVGGNPPKTTDLLPYLSGPKPTRKEAVERMRDRTRAELAAAVRERMRNRTDGSP